MKTFGYAGGRDEGRDAQAQTARRAGRQARHLPRPQGHQGCRREAHERHLGSAAASTPCATPSPTPARAAAASSRPSWRPPSLRTAPRPQKARVTGCHQAPSRAIARHLATGARASCRARWSCFEDDFEACIAHLRTPVIHRRRRAAQGIWWGRQWTSKRWLYSGSLRGSNTSRRPSSPFRRLTRAREELASYIDAYAVRRRGRRPRMQ
jgi:hypothetical protein